MATPAEVVEQLCRLAVVAQQEVELPVAVVVEDGETPAVLDTVDAVDEGDVGERAVTVVAEEDVPLVSVQAVLADVDQ